MRAPGRWIAAAMVPACLVAGPAWAHVAVPGIAGAYGAFVHASTEPPALLALLGLGVLLGLQGPEAVKLAWTMFFATMSAGLVLTLMAGVVVDPERPLLFVSMAAGLLAASGWRLPALAAGALGAMAGLAFGVFAAPSPASWSTKAYFIAGGLLGANLTLIVVVAAVDSIRQRWPQAWALIGLKVLSSWIAAIAAMVAALSLAR